MTDMINDRLDDLDDLRDLGENDSVVDIVEATPPKSAQSKKPASPFSAKASETESSSDELDELRDLGEDDSPVEEKPVMAVESKKPASPFSAKASETESPSDELDDLRDLGEDDSPVEEKAVMAVESKKPASPFSAKTSETESASDELDELRDLGEDDSPVEEKAVMAVEVKSPEKPVVASETKSPEKPVVVNETKSPEKPVIASEAKSPEKPTPAPKTEETASPATPLPAPMTTDGEVIFNPTFSLRVFLFLRHLIIKFFDAILTGIAIVLEQCVTLYQTGIFGKIASPFRAGFSAISNRIPNKYHKAFYAIVAILCFGLLSVYSVLALSSSDNKLGFIGFTQTINISQTNVNQDIIAHLFTPTVQYWASDIETWTSETTVTPHMLAIVMQLESCGNPSVQAGLFGVGNSDNNLDAQANTAVDKLQSALNISNGNVSLALAIYSEGERVLTDDFATWTLHTRDMFMIGGTLYNQAELAQTSSPDLNSWLQNTGALLCTDTLAVQNG